MRPLAVQPSLLGLTVLVAFSLGSTIFEAAQPQPADDPHGVRARVEAYERAWNTHEPTALATFFIPDADMLMGNGPRIRGRDAIVDWWDTYFQGLDPGRGGRFTIDSIRLIAPAVALVNVDSRTAGRDSQTKELPPRLARGTWVMVRQDDEWLITAMRGRGDNYFRRGDADPPDLNKVRAKVQLRLFETLRAREAELRRIVAQVSR